MSDLLLSDSVYLRVFWQVSWSEKRVSQQSLVITYAWRRRNLVNRISLRDFLKLMSCLLPEFEELPSKMVLPQRRFLHNTSSLCGTYFLENSVTENSFVMLDFLQNQPNATQTSLKAVIPLSHCFFLGTRQI